MGQIGAVSIKNQSVVIASSGGSVAHFPIQGSRIQPDDPDMMEVQVADAAIVAMTMDDFNNEGLIGTEAGSIFYVNFAEKVLIKLVSSNNRN